MILEVGVPMEKPMDWTLIAVAGFLSVELIEHVIAALIAKHKGGSFQLRVTLQKSVVDGIGTSILLIAVLLKMW